MSKKITPLVISAVFLLLVAGVVGSQAAQILLPGTSIPKFVDPLPVAGDITVVNATPAGTPAYNIHMREFQAQILPASLGLQPSWVWGYLTDADLALQPAVRPSYLGPVVVAQRGVVTNPTYTNELPLGAASMVQQILPVDQTLDWANPEGVNCAPDALGNYTNPICGILPYLGPLPDGVHIHGAEVAAAFDGGPDAWFTQGNAQTGPGFPGNTFTYHNGQQEATIWFHPHGLGITRLNVFAGMAGVYPIVDPANPPLAVMPAFPQYDIPLIIQDRSFDTTGQIFYNLASNPQPNPTVHPFWIPEFIGDAIVVNGKTWPFLNVEPRQYRFRVLNGSNARFYDLTMQMTAMNPRFPNMTLTTMLPFIAIATDSGYLVNAVSTPNLIIAPGERYEVIVDFTNMPAGSTIIMKNSARTPFPGGAKPTRNGTDTIMKFVVNQPLSATPNTAIAAGTPIRPFPLEPIVNGFVAGTNITRQLTLNEIIGAGGPLELVVNNSKFNLPLNTPGCPGGTGTCRETELPAVGDTEIWEIINITADAHPMHTHLVSFQILDRTPFKMSQWVKQYDALMLANGVLPGAGPPSPYNVRNADGAIGGNPAINAFLDLKKRTLPLPYEMGWKDTAVMYPGQVTRIAVRWATQDAPVVGTACGPCGTVSNPTPCAASCVPGVGSNTYPFDPTALIGGVGYVWHCHILDHEDNEMMRNYTVMETRQPVL